MSERKVVSLQFMMKKQVGNDVFEKETEKHCNDVLCSVCENPTCTEHLKCREWRDRRAGFYCGAEFGYNKANEWHKVSDKLPPIGESVLLYYGVDIMGKAIVSTGCVDCKGNWYKNVDKEPVMWKEVVLPKEE